MRLLIVTQKVNMDDPILGFFHRWILEFAKKCESLVVICLEEGAHELPLNVKVLTLGKGSAEGSQFSYIFKFYRHVWHYRNEYDAVFVHMNPIYVVLGGFIWKILKKKVSLWYTHKNTDMKLRFAERFVDHIFTASKESFTLVSSKVLVTGHGIDVAQYADTPRSKTIGVEPFKLLSVGRITPIKNCDVLIEAAHLLKTQWNRSFTVDFVGNPTVASDIAYKEKLVSLVSKYELSDIVRFIGDVSPQAMPEQYAGADATINLAPTGGADKVVLESMAAGVPVFVTNETFKPYLGMYIDTLMFRGGDAQDLSLKIMKFFSQDITESVGAGLQKIAQEKADIRMLIQTISAKLE